jgi:glutamate carboxypeptidase
VAHLRGVGGQNTEEFALSWSWKPWSHRGDHSRIKGRLGQTQGKIAAFRQQPSPQQPGEPALVRLKQKSRLFADYLVPDAVLALRLSRSEPRYPHRITQGRKDVSAASANRRGRNSCGIANEMKKGLAMNSYIASRYGRFLQDLETLVNVDSGSGQAQGLTTVARFFQERFDRLGWHTRLLEFNGGAAPCLEVLNRNSQPAAGRFDFLLLGHMDTVFPAGTARQRPFSIRDGRARGPGVCDMKAGLVTVLHAAEALQLAGVADGLSVCIAFNSDEEIGSRASRAWFEALASRSRRVLVFEPCRATGHRVLQRKGVADFEVLCHGRAAHAGVEPEKGANAVLELAHQVLAVIGFARPADGTTVSVTTIAGGTAGNVIPDFARAGFDVRIASIEEARRIEACFQHLSASGQTDGVRVEVRGEINRLPMIPSEATWRLWEQITRIGEGLCLEMKLISTGGGSDGNFTAALGIPTVDAMGPRGGRAHSADEYLELDSVVPNTQMICEVLKAAAENRLP